MRKDKFIEGLKNVKGLKRLWLYCNEEEILPGNFWLGIESGKNWYNDGGAFENILDFLEDKDLLDDEIVFNFILVDFDLQDMDEEFIKNYLVDLTNRYELLVGDINEYL